MGRTTAPTAISVESLNKVVDLFKKSQTRVCGDLSKSGLSRSCPWKHWREDPYYSAQGQAGTCTRHALAKSIYREVEGWTQGRIHIPISSAVTMLVNQKPELGGRGGWPEEWNGIKGTVVGEGGHIYDLTLRVDHVKPDSVGHIAVVDLRSVLPDYKNEKEEKLHSMFVLFRSGDDEVICQNSWGECDKMIHISKQEATVRFYYVTVTDLIWRGSGKRGDTVIFQNGSHLTPSEWPHEE